MKLKCLVHGAVMTSLICAQTFEGEEEILSGPWGWINPPTLSIDSHPAPVLYELTIADDAQTPIGILAVRAGVEVLEFTLLSYLFH